MDVLERALLELKRDCPRNGYRLGWCCDRSTHERMELISGLVTILVGLQWAIVHAFGGIKAQGSGAKICWQVISINLNRLTISAHEGSSSVGLACMICHFAVVWQ